MDAEDIRTNKYDLSINRYKEVVYEEEQYEDPKVILQKLKALEGWLRVSTLSRVIAVRHSRIQV